MSKITSQRLRKMLDEANVHPDVVSRRKDGAFLVKRGYFYRHGNSAEKWGKYVIASLPGWKLIETTDAWKAWPRDSYFVAVVAPEGAANV